MIYYSCGCTAHEDQFKFILYLISVAEECIQLHNIPITAASDSKYHFFEILARSIQILNNLELEY